MLKKEGDEMATKKAVQTADEAESKKKKNTAKKTENKTKPKKDMPKTKNGLDDYTIRDSETAKRLGRNGGIRSGEVRRAKRDARDTIQYMLGRMTKSEQIVGNLKELGFEESELSNMAALHGRLFTMAMSGNLDAYMTLMRMGGYEPEENRKERESVSADRRREVELDAKVTALGSKGDNSSMALNLNDEDGDNDVVIYMPQIEPEEDCEVKDEKKENGEDSADNE